MHFPYSFSRVTTAVLAAGGLFMDGASISAAETDSSSANLAPEASSPASTKMRAPTVDETIVFDALDLERPELAPIAAAVKEGNYDEATRRFGEYFRQRRERFTWRREPGLPSYRHVEAKNALEGKVRVVAIDHTFPDGNINWHYNATQHIPGEALNHEWLWQLNRMGFWNDMAGAYAATGDERYPEVFVKQFRSWIEQCPMPSKEENEAGSTWRTIEVGIRMRGWYRLFFEFLPSPAITDQDILKYVRSTIEQGRYLRKYQTTANWLIMELSGLAAAGCYLPELRESAEWRSYAFARLTEEFDSQFLQDGGHFELSPGYHAIAVGDAIDTFEVARRTGRETELPPNYLSAVERAYSWLMFLSTPNRNLPKFNDSWPREIEPIAQNALSYYPNREDFRWFATGAKEGKPPEKASMFMDWSGFAIMRSGWEKNANYLVFDVGPLGRGGHAHYDKLNLVLWAYGRELLLDNGGGSYERSKWRHWSMNTHSHNCVLVDGLGQNRPAGVQLKNNLKNVDQRWDPARVSQVPIDARWKSNPSFDFATAVYDEGFGPEKGEIATHQRSVCFIKPDIYIVVDTLTPRDGKPHTYQARWHLLSTETASDPQSSIVMTRDEGLPNLAIVPLLTAGLKVQAASAQEEPEILGWNVMKDKKPMLAPATTVVHTREGGGVQRFATLLLPLRAGEQSPLKQITPRGNSIDIHLNDGRRYQVSLSKAGDGVSIQQTLGHTD